MPGTLIEIPVQIVMLSIWAISLRLWVHSSLVYLSIWVLYLCLTDRQYLVVKDTIYYDAVWGTAQFENSLAFNLVIYELPFEESPICKQYRSCSMSLILNECTLVYVSILIDHPSVAVFKAFDIPTIISRH